jgi:hypothetical protein
VIQKNHTNKGKGMLQRYLGLIISVVSLMLSACSITHPIAKDYPQYLTNNQATTMGHTDLNTGYALTPATAAHHYEFRAMMTGGANLWVVEFGQMLDQTLQSSQVQRAFGKLTKEIDTDGNKLLFDLVQYQFNDFSAHIELRVTYSRSGHEVLSKSYRADGQGQGGKMFFAGAFGMKNAIQQSTKLALDEILGKLITELNAAH